LHAHTERQEAAIAAARGRLERDGSRAGEFHLALHELRPIHLRREGADIPQRELEQDRARIVEQAAARLVDVHDPPRGVVDQHGVAGFLGAGAPGRVQSQQLSRALAPHGGPHGSAATRGGEVGEQLQNRLVGLVEGRRARRACSLEAPQQLPLEAERHGDDVAGRRLIWLSNAGGGHVRDEHGLAPLHHPAERARGAQLAGPERGGGAGGVPHDQPARVAVQQRQMRAARVEQADDLRGDDAADLAVVGLGGELRRHRGQRERQGTRLGRVGREWLAGRRGHGFGS
jgi:hypothetical protein